MRIFEIETTKKWITIKFHNLNYAKFYIIMPDFTIIFLRSHFWFYLTTLRFPAMMKISTFCPNMADDRSISGLILKIEGLKMHCLIYSSGCSTTVREHLNIHINALQLFQTIILHIQIYNNKYHESSSPSKLFSLQK
jgi:hypothetical protein